MQASWCAPVLRSIFAIAGALALPVAGTLHAQRADTAESVDEIVELSPFVVTDNAHVGYIASQSTVGSRLKQEIRDIASQIEIMTPEFMQDFALTTVQESFRYSVNVENADEYLTPTGDIGAFLPGGNVGRIRGMGTRLPISRNLFGSATPADGYNFSHVEIASGAQSMLYGIGQPAGRANISLNAAEMRTFGKFSTRIDTESGYRNVMDINAMIIPKVLAVRAAVLNENAKTFIDPSFRKSERLYGALTFRPFRHTTLRIHGEKVQMEANPGITHLPWDYATPFYIARRDGVLDSLQTVALGAGAGSANIMTGAYEGSLDYLHWRASVYPVGPSQLPFDIPRFGSAMDPNLGVARVTLNPGNIHLVPNASANIGRNILGDNARSHGKYSVLNMFLEQRILRNLTLELGMQIERTATRLHMLGGYFNYAYYADVNEFIPKVPWTATATAPSGPNTEYEVNPNYGKVYARAAPTGDWNIYESNDYRASLVWQPDLEKINKWLGRHSFVASASATQSQSKSQAVQLKLRNATLEYQNLTGSYSNNARRQILFQHYFDADHLALDKPVQGMSVDDYFYGWQFTEPTTGQVLDVTGWGSDLGGARPSGSRTKLNSYIFAWQGRLLDDRLLLTYGYREDHVKQYQLHDAAGSDAQRTEPAELNGCWKWIDEIGFNPDSEISDTGRTHTYGVIGRPLGWLSLAYYQSETFNLPTGAHTPFGGSVPGANGTSDDYSIRFDFNKGRSYVKFNYYKTLQKKTSVGGYGSVFINSLYMEKSYMNVANDAAIA
jgi:hypothetical protein